MTKLKIGDVVYMQFHPEIVGTILWIADDTDLEGRPIHIEQNGKTYRVSEKSIKLLKKSNS